MKQLILNILKENFTVDNSKFERNVLSLLSDEGFDNTTPYIDIINFIKKQLSIEGLEAFQLFQLFKDNYKTLDDTTELIRKDITKTSLKTANIRARDLVKSKIPFKGSNTNSKYYDNGTYVVFSYDWYPIYVNKDGQWFENVDGYSMSTKKQMSQLRPFGEGDIFKISKDEMWDIIKSK
jgi:hypothetical protein